MSCILFVRATSSLPVEELEKRLLKRKPEFLEVEGLFQKIYSRDPETGAVSGIYFFRSEEDLVRFQQSELAKTIASVYEVTEIRVEKYDVMYPLREGVGPV